MRGYYFETIPNEPRQKPRQQGFLEAKNRLDLCNRLGVIPSEVYIEDAKKTDDGWVRKAKR